MKATIRRAVISVCWVGVAIATGCGSSNDDGSGSGNVSIVFKSSALSSALRLERLANAPSSGTNCSASVDGSPVTGKCYSPLRVAGFFSSASLSSTTGGAPVRLLGGGDHLHGFADIFRHEAFDLKTQVAMVGDDNIQDGSGGPYNLLSLNSQAIEYSFEAKVGGTDKVYTVRTFFADSIPSVGSTLSSCGLLEGELADADLYGTLYSSIAARRGDILVCIKTSTSAACADSDFVWVDAAGSTHATRPGSPLQLTGTYLTSTPSCVAGERPDISWSSTDFVASLSSAVSVSASFDGGTKIYSSGGSTGNKLTVTVDVSSAESLFVPSGAAAVADLSNVASEAVLLQNLDKILLKPIYVSNAKSSAANSGDAALSATVSLSISNE